MEVEGQLPALGSSKHIGAALVFLSTDGPKEHWVEYHQNVLRASSAVLGGMEERREDECVHSHANFQAYVCTCEVMCVHGLTYSLSVHVYYITCMCVHM